MTPFVKKKHKVEKGDTILHLMGLSPVKGDVGIEIEVEGHKFPKHPYNGNPGKDAEKIPGMWTYHHDGSLRGEDNAEYVLRRPIKFEEVPEAVTALFDMFKEYGSVLDVSNRTSVHVHLNVQNFHLNRLAALMGLYFSVEELLTAWCGEHRVGNLFCLRGRDATAIVTELRKFVRQSGRHSLKNGMHYAGFNAGAIANLGSVEIRLLRGVNDPDTIIEWVSILERIYRLSEDFPDPRQIPSLLSSEGCMGYLTRLLGDKVPAIVNEIEYDVERIKDALYTGIRLAQDICYCRDWSLYQPVVTEIDVFGRKMKKTGAASTEDMSTPTVEFGPTVVSSGDPDQTISFNSLSQMYSTAVSPTTGLSLPPLPSNPAQILPSFVETWGQLGEEEPHDYFIPDDEEDLDEFDQEEEEDDEI